MKRQTSAGSRDLRTQRTRPVDLISGHSHDRTMDNRIRLLEVQAVETRDRLSRIETTLGHVATAEAMAAMRSGLRDEMGDIKSELRSEMGDMKSELRKEMGDMKSELRKEMGDMKSELRKEMGDMKSDLIMHMEGIRTDLMRWSIMVMLTLATLSFTAARYIH